MDDELTGAMQRLELFLESKSADTIVDDASKLTTNDLQMLLGEVNMARFNRQNQPEAREMFEGPAGLM